MAAESPYSSIDAFSVFRKCRNSKCRISVLFKKGNENFEVLNNILLYYYKYIDGWIDIVNTSYVFSISNIYIGFPVATDSYFHSLNVLPLFGYS